MAEKIEIFFCYAREDEVLRQGLEKQLSALRRQNFIDLWHDRNISAGTDWEKEINLHLNAAHIILLLISSDFMDSDYCFGIEMKRAIERHYRGEARVVPIILRPVYWQKSPFGKLQALPTNAKPITTWSNPDEAFFDVAEGIRNAIEELTIQLQARKISLFGYEMQGGRNSVLWTNPFTFSLDEAYEAWRNTKRDFSTEEIIDRIWIKTCNPEHTYIVRFSSDGSLRESSLSDSSKQWSGSWKLLDGMLRINIGDYELDIFANREGSVHSGIEFMKGMKDPDAYFVCFPSEDFSAKHWDITDVPTLVERIFDQVLDQQANTRCLITYGSLLCRGEMSVRNIIKILGLSQEYRDRFTNTTIEEAIESCYAQFLGREVDASGKRNYVKEAQAKGFTTVIATIIDSEEYTRNFKEDAIPPKVLRRKEYPSY